MVRLGRTQRSDQIRRHLLDVVKSGQTDFIADACARFGVSRQTIHRHLAKLVEKGYLIAEGSTRARKYRLGSIRVYAAAYDLAAIAEHVVYERDFAFIFEDLPPNVEQICHYGFTEMVNNAIDHSEGTQVLIMVSRDRNRVIIEIDDDGEGIFKRISRLMDLTDPRESILELSKGKFTTDPEHHTGEGIFFASRVFDYYAVYSGDLWFSHDEEQKGRDILFHQDQDQEGTIIIMLIRVDSPRTMREIYDEFAGPEEYGFDKTIVPVRLALYEGERLVSRSQAKRLMNRVEKFKEVFLDFQGVDYVGRSFVDEIFRVFATRHRDIKLFAINMNAEITRVVESVRRPPVQDLFSD